MIPWMTTLPKRTGKIIYYDIRVKNSNVVTNPEDQFATALEFLYSSLFFYKNKIYLTLT